MPSLIGIAFALHALYVNGRVIGATADLKNINNFINAIELITLKL